MSATAIDINEYDIDSIRNFSIIAHIDHGTISKETKNLQVLDKLPVERQRGITVKAQSATMFYTYKNKKYLINLIDTPGHVDFSYEVSRSLSACQGTILLVDSSQGIQAQTVANFYLAFSQNLSIIPVLNKVDLPGADPEKVQKQLLNAFEFDSKDMLKISAKSGLNIDKVLDLVIEKTPHPTGNRNNPLKALLFDSWYNSYVGVICMMSIVDGTIKKGDKIISAHTGEKYEISQVGIMSPEMKSTTALHAGQVGYIVCNMKFISEAHVGDTFFLQKFPVEALEGFQQPKPMVFSGLFPADTNDLVKLQEAISQLTLNDCSVSVYKETSFCLGQGWRLGFLGTLHMDVFKQRLEDEYGIDVILSHPTVPYKVKTTDGKEILIKSPADFPDKVKLNNKIESITEPFMSATIIVPKDYLGATIKLCSAKIGYEDADLVKMEVLINSKPVDALAAVLHSSRVEIVGKDIAKRLKDLIKRQLFDISVQTTSNGRVIARETIKAMRKNVIAKCYGGDITRKMKLLNRQKEGKKRLKSIGNVEVPHEAFISLMTKKS
ncbi:hypothetical protein BB561_005916 [Smittium simulii]|uniref:Tr-type G domain-containing protein n=1 Tax=Smittium simulii TaxID=133385 RepID=A0A2T9Y7Q9_9FUNG|nr:hypothetical protein BB561_005916 [Smittium simulii]